ncbi:hypothetical protein PM738_16865 [Erysipelatoclostridium ramosum]|uniref:Uncharacterized protein n=1 Tax=Thomasclavelia ramosa TaxID=1547 RepID=A0AB35IN21_9FIRM|nr:hypothetical protein [Thomasclavelia ramosa]MDB7085482.1 hypothetical protein [Thomasclavelia ramosa]
MDDILYKNALYYKKEILPYTFILKLKNELMIITAKEQDFGHLVGKQYSMNLEIKSLGQKEFFEQALSQNITYEKLLAFDKDTYRNEFNWIENKNSSFIFAFNSFINNANLKLYQAVGKEIYTKLTMDYFHQKGESDTEIVILGIVGNNMDDTFLFNTILSNDEELQRRFNKCKRVKIRNFYKILNKNLKTTLSEFDLNIKASPNNINLKPKKKNSIKKSLLSSTDFKEINSFLDTSLKIGKGMNGNKSLKIIKDRKVVEKGIRLNLKDFKSNIEIAEYINKKYK